MVLVQSLWFCPGEDPWEHVGSKLSSCCQIFEQVLSELEPLCLAEQDFISKFFKLQQHAAVQPPLAQVQLTAFSEKSMEKMNGKCTTGDRAV